MQGQQSQDDEENGFVFYPGYYDMDASHSEDTILTEERTTLLHIHKGKNHSAWEQLVETFR